MELSPLYLAFLRLYGALDSTGFEKSYQFWSKQLRLESHDDPAIFSSSCQSPLVASGYQSTSEPASTVADLEDSLRSCRPIFPLRPSGPLRTHNPAGPQSRFGRQSERN